MMTKYCITAANHKNEDINNHCASEFKVWKMEGMFLWTLIGTKSIYDVCDLLKNGCTVYSAKEEGGVVKETGEPVNIMLRISKNESK
ncbi:MAG: hypothetical protein Q8N28_00035 [bacterium]|nr:hypothetical protein [bacterium]